MLSHSVCNFYERSIIIVETGKVAVFMGVQHRKSYKAIWKGKIAHRLAQHDVFTYIAGINASVRVASAHHVVFDEVPKPVSSLADAAFNDWNGSLAK